MKYGPGYWRNKNKIARKEIYYVNKDKGDKDKGDNVQEQKVDELYFINRYHKIKKQNNGNNNNNKVCHRCGKKGHIAQHCRTQ